MRCHYLPIIPQIDKLKIDKTRRENSHRNSSYFLIRKTGKKIHFAVHKNEARKFEPKTVWFHYISHEKFVN